VVGRIVEDATFIFFLPLEEMNCRTLGFQAGEQHFFPPVGLEEIAERRDFSSPRSEGSRPSGIEGRISPSSPMTSGCVLSCF